MLLKGSSNMNKALAAVLIGATLLSGTAATAQTYGGYRDSDRDGRSDRQEWNRDRDRDGRRDQYDRHDRRSDRYRHQSYRYYGGQYGYDGYNGRWRSGQRYPYYNQSRYYLNDYSYYGLPAPRSGYRYYRDDNGDVVMAAIASGVIGLIIGGLLADNNHDRYDRGYDGYGYGYDNGYGYNGGYGGYGYRR
jgi:Ni/Co efflux regulator RcnB